MRLFTFSGIILLIISCSTGDKPNRRSVGIR